jgi:putative ABC transport system permease protein
MIYATSIRSLFRRRSRAVLALAGIAVSSALLLDMTMMATGLARSFEELIGARGFSMRVAPRGTLPFDSEAGIRDAARIGVVLAGVPGIEQVAPVLGAQLYRVEGDSLAEPIFTSGLTGGTRFLYDLERGADAGDGEVVVSRPLADALSLEVGDTVRLAAELDLTLGGPRATAPYRVSGIADFLFDYAGQRSLAMELREVQRITNRPDEVSLFAVATDGSADDDRLASSIQQLLPEVSVYSTREMMVEMSRRLLYFRQLATILGTVSLVVAGLLVATIITIGVRERFGEIATLRVLGVRSSRILLSIGAQGLVLSSIGCALGVPLGVAVARWLDGILLSFPGIPASVSFFVWDPARVGFAVALVICTGTLSGLVPGWSAIRTPLGNALREEAD